VLFYLSRSKRESVEDHFRKISAKNPNPAKFPCYLLVNPRGQRGKKEKRGKKKGKKRREKEKESNSL
jgi:hypothetical protein